MLDPIAPGLAVLAVEVDVLGGVHVVFFQEYLQQA
jgi:hypothetical protein